MHFTLDMTNGELLLSGVRVVDVLSDVLDNRVDLQATLKRHMETQFEAGLKLGLEFDGAMFKLEDEAVGIFRYRCRWVVEAEGEQFSYERFDEALDAALEIIF